MTDNKTAFGDKIVSDITNAANSLRRVVIAPRDVPSGVYVSIEFNNLLGDYLLTLDSNLPLSRHFARNLSNALSGIITWADNESWPARDDYNMRIARERIELDELQAQEAKA
jgi:hypothetical protein